MRIVSSWVDQTPQNTLKLLSPPSAIRFKFRVEASETKRWLVASRRDIARHLQTSSGFKISSVRRDLRRTTVASSLIRSLRISPSPPRGGSRLTQLIVFALTHPLHTVLNISRNFIIDVESTGDVVHWNEEQRPPLTTAFVFDEELDFWSRSMAVSDSNRASIKLFNVAVSIGVPASSLPLIKFACSSPTEFLNFVVETHSIDIASTYGEVLAPLPHYRGIELLVRGVNHPKVQRIRAVTQGVLDHTGRDTTPLFSHRQLDNRRTLQLRDVEVLFGRFTVCGESLYLFESGADLRNPNPAGLWPYFWSRPPLGGKALLLDGREEQHIREAAAGFGRIDSNWFHLLIETLPRLVDVCDATSDEVPLLVQDGIPETGLDLIRGLIGPNRAIQQLSSNVIKVGTLYVATGRTAAVDSPYLDVLTCSLEKQSLLSLRSRIWKSFPESSNQNLPQRIVAVRNSHYRRLTNSQRVLRQACRSGFEPVALGAQSVGEQVALFKNADEIVIQTGAGMANLLFARPGTRVLGLVGPNKDQWKFWADFCDVLDLDSRFVVGNPAGRKDDDSAHADFRIPISHLKKTLVPGLRSDREARL
jgi:hypothetical protein